MINKNLENGFFDSFKKALGEEFFWGSSTLLDLREINDLLLKEIEEKLTKQKLLGLKTFKFSLSWSLVFPTEKVVNQEILDFYAKVITICLSLEVEPYVVFFDGTTPDWVTDNGGWANRQIINYFENYVATVVRFFVNKVKYYVVFKTTSCFSDVNQFLSKQIPNKKNIDNFMPSIHHAVLCQSIAVKTVKKFSADAQIGTTFSFASLRSSTFSIKDLKATDRADALLNKIFIEPALGLGYPLELLPFLKNIKKHFYLGDEELIKTHFDFIFVQNLIKVNIAYNSYIPYLNAKIIKTKNNDTQKKEEAFDNSLYQMVLKFSQYQVVKKIFLVDNKLFITSDFDLNKPDDTNLSILYQVFFKQIVYIKSKISQFEGCYFCN